ncbi:hypothetical protein GWI33_001137 [Rhynchophorus ferrugineus]|uniref:Uncharacterized protein n=1 Tax=Rhynchophorus ferrugineus TaxID=354439 RepID=A0A834IZC2_RHYFE|nr:hypothetical protein GWI33_001137 [Rhynchophorus ferrugineus]
MIKGRNGDERYQESVRVVHWSVMRIITDVASSPLLFGCRFKFLRCTAALIFSYRDERRRPAENEREQTTKKTESNKVPSIYVDSDSLRAAGSSFNITIPTKLNS